MGQNTNIGQATSLTVFGNPESFIKLIKNHGSLCKIKQTLACPCVAINDGSADMHCTVCDGEGYVYTYQRRFLISDENSRSCEKTVTPFWQPILAVEKVQNVTSEIQGGITTLTVESFTSSEITLTESTTSYEKKRVTYYFDGWTYVAEEKLRVDATNKIMYADGTIYDAGYQSSNPLNAYADIATVVRIWNKATGQAITSYNVVGNTITTTQNVDADNMYIEYYKADLTQVINTDVVNRDNNEVWTHDLKSGECRMAFYPYWELTKGDIVVLAATVLYKNETLTHRGNIDKLSEIEIFSLNDVILDENGVKYYIDSDYILQGRHLKWIGSKPDNDLVITVRYGYKPSYIIFEDNPMPNNLENKQYPIIVMAKSWSNVTKNDVAKLFT